MGLSASRKWSDFFGVAQRPASLQRQQSLHPTGEPTADVLHRQATALQRE